MSPRIAIVGGSFPWAPKLIVDTISSGGFDSMRHDLEMLADPLGGRIDDTELAAMADELLAATAPWLPQLA